MGYAIMQIVDESGEYVDWDGRLVAGPDGTLGSVVIRKVLEEQVTRVEGMEVNLPGGQEVVVASHQVPVGEVHKVFGYGLSADNTGVDYFGVKVSGALKAKVYTDLRRWPTGRPPSHRQHRGRRARGRGARRAQRPGAQPSRGVRIRPDRERDQQPTTLR